MFQIIHTKKFEKDLKQCKKRGWNMRMPNSVIKQMKEGGHPESRFNPHKLKGEWSGFWECHISFDWLIVYTIQDDEIKLFRTGTHEDIFGK